MLLYPPIQHPLVAEYQRRLLALGYREVGAVSGVYDAQTEAAVQHFEWLNGLPVDGAIDAATAAQLESPEALAYRLPPPFAGRILRRGMYVHALEQPLLARLAVLGYLPAGRADTQGKFTLQDERALRRFQADNGLPVSGQLDLDTWEWAYYPRARTASGWPANGGPPDDSPDGSFPPGWRSAIVPVAEGLPDSQPVLAEVRNGQVWLARADGALLWFDPAAAALHGPLFIGDLNLQDSPIRPLGMAAIGRLLWIYSSVPGGQVLQGFDTLTGLARPPLRLPDPPSDCPPEAGNCPPARAFGFDGRRLWLAGPGTAVRAVHPTSGTTLAVRTVSGVPAGRMAFDGQCLWVVLLDGQIAAVDPGLGTCRAAGTLLAPGQQPTPAGSLSALALLAAQDGLVWHSAPGSARVEVFDAASGQPRAALDFDSPLTVLAHAGGQLWVGQASGRLTPLDALSAAPGPAIELGCAPLALAGDGPLLWAACDDGSLRRVKD
jgi:peptidoglycan hydrolase-like protein with peptidoglycan-binding domain